MSEYIVRMPNNMPPDIRAELNAWYVNSEPIVRCRDCKHNLNGACEHWDYCDIHDYENGFCAWGERRPE